jgi:serine/threonine protein kinase
MYSQSAIYCITEPYRGTRLKAYLENETLTKSQFKSLLSQVVMALGQLHECNVVYNAISLDGLFMLDEGFIMLNDFSRSWEANSDSAELEAKAVRPPEGEGEGKSVTGCWDWWNLGHLIYFIKEQELCNLTTALLEPIPEKRLGFRNDYHEVLGHAYFKNINKK